MSEVKNPSLYRAVHQLRKGNLHKALSVPEDETIPASKIEAATHSDNKHISAMARFAKTLKGLKK